MRDAIGAEGELLLLGRFEGFTYFSSSLVETGFLLVRRKRSDMPPPHVDVLVSGEGAEDAALRVLRRGTRTAEGGGTVELFSASATSFKAGSWLPRRRADVALIERLDSLQLPTVGRLFDIHQGMRTGLKEAFLLTEDEVKSLRNERRHFRKAAGQGTLRNGCLIEREYVFYPYAPGGALIGTEEQLKKEVPRYYEKWLKPLEPRLRKRKKIDQWWLPTWPRNWQFETRRKLVSTYFGNQGSFAFDDTGEYVVVEGFAWLWLGELPPDPDEPDEPMEFDNTILPFAYLSLLNSTLFERVISCFSWRLQGGQMRLENRFLGGVPLPDLSDNDRVARETVQTLARLGREIQSGELKNIVAKIDEASHDAYGLPV